MRMNYTGELPVDAHLTDIAATLSKHSSLVLVAQPGAGKTTRVPLSLLQQPWVNLQKILLLEPRRVAARLAAAFMAQQLGEQVGETVGYRMRGETCCGPATRLEVVTQGVLTRMLQDDPLLEGVACVIFDEYHERSLEADLGLALVLDVQQSIRDDLRLVVMSATLDTDALLALLGETTPLIECEGRQYPVTTHYRPCRSDVALDAHCAAVVKEALKADHEGDVLVILPGVGEIERTARQLSRQGIAALVNRLHGRMPLADQRETLRASPDQQRVILATAIVESSVTVDGVACVIDAGLERVPTYQHRTGAGQLETRRVNRASADQRRGRAGRQGAGVCYRLWSQEQPLPPHREPELQQADLAGLVFELARWGVKDPRQLAWMTPPPQGAWSSAQRTLIQLGILDQRCQLTSLGQRCGRWPLPPRLAVMVERSSSLDATSLACLLAMLLESGERLELHLEQCLARALGSAFHQKPLWFTQAKRLAKRAGVEVDDAVLKGSHHEKLVALLAFAYPDRIAYRLSPGRFQLVNGVIADIALDDTLAHHDWLLIAHWRERREGYVISAAMSIESTLVTELFPDARQWQASVAWSDKQGKLVAREVRALGAIELESRPLRERLPRSLIDNALVEAVQRRGYLPQSDALRQLQGRMCLLNVHDTDADWPDWSEAILLETLESWLVPYLGDISTLNALDKLPLDTLLLEGLSWQARQQMDRLVPRRVDVPTGGMITLDYQPCLEGQPPVLAAKLQELFGWQDAPSLINGKIKVQIHLLSPARRPLQVTQDLAHFWQHGYADVRKEMRGRYPKHPWPEDPLTALATAKTKPRGG
ncbi:ATP-dependent helicase HrpB [Halomonas sp. LS-001]